MQVHHEKLANIICTNLNNVNILCAIYTTRELFFSDVVGSWRELFQFTLLDNIDGDDIIIKKSQELDIDTKEKMLRGASMMREHCPFRGSAQNMFNAWSLEQADLGLFRRL
ncbi:hypothetical protein Glove_52g152 [Diversispora epigaea]|uniref:Uncharacterized protein n=1 Tax=Diversispora epigaea TaxID=1348612 RepID=A0A397JE08_9GLOM|nr:hypothetical protein Glove_52g152 [Diversispora epigaea]